MTPIILTETDDALPDTAGEAGGQPVNEPGPLLLTAPEIEVLLCFTLTSPLYYGPVEEGLCDKLRRRLRELHVVRVHRQAQMSDPLPCPAQPVTQPPERGQPSPSI